MFDWFSNILGLVGSGDSTDRATKLNNDFIRHEAKIGGKLFGPVPRNRRRDFFCLDSHTWIWHEEWLDQNGQNHIQTTRYEVRPDGVVKAQDGQMQYQKVGDEELQRLIKAAKMYEAQVYQEIYQPIFQS
ncbi:hypothetical protein A3F37_01735 [Candidatus Saccharibacteria bacterium RIFCSPHIGHO2_12_FULL_41_12]|nr:MAG: hypothetical protein A3F37_01735 [Candidatus Saccharibacteria bacterium RIFCSPHIGHO2_12_FULL_41_12]